MSGGPDVHPSVVAALDAAAAPWRVVRHTDLGREVRGPADVAASLGWDEARITKTLLLRGRSGRHALVVCPVMLKLDFGKVAALLGERHEVAPREDLAEVVGYPVTGVTPLGVAGVPVLVDSALVALGSVLTGGGTAGVEVEVAVDDLVALTGATVADVSQ